MEPVTRIATVADLGLLARIEDAADQLFIDRFQPDSWGSAPSGYLRAAEPGFVLVRETAGGQIAGFVHVLETDGACHLEQLAVDPAFARQGHGRALVKAAREHATERGHTRMTLRTYVDVPWNGPFYAALGFTSEEPRTPFEQDLVRIEAELGLEQYGPREQMAISLT